MLTALSPVVIIGLSMGLYGYDNNFAAPLVQLPLFIEKYQGPGLTFTVRRRPTLPQCRLAAL
jgi:hypothetical protein